MLFLQRCEYAVHKPASSSTIPLFHLSDTFKDNILAMRHYEARFNDLHPLIPQLYQNPSHRR